MTEANVETLWQRLRRRKVVQWGIAYAAGAWGLLQGLGYVTQTFSWSPLVPQLATLALLVGLPIVLVLAWYHGDRGEQRVTATELAIIALLFLIGGALFWRYERIASARRPATAANVESGIDTTASAVGKAPRNSIAVLPFVNMSQDTANEYFSDGISEEILNSLAQIPALKVAARTSSFSFKGEKKEVPDIARDLKVRMVLEGSVRKQGERVRITAQLIDAENGFHVWSQTYDRDLKDIFAVQDEIAHAIAGALRMKLAATHAASNGKPGSVDVQAYDLYLRGLALWQARGKDNIRAALSCFKQATARDPKLAKAWAGIALVETISPDWFGTPEDEAARATRDAAERALALDPTLPEAYAALGNTAFNDGRWDTGRALFDRAIALSPSYATAWQWYGIGLSMVDTKGEAVAIAKRAVELDPKSSVVRQDLAMTLYRAGRFEESEAESRRLLDDPQVRETNLTIVFDNQMARRDYAGARETMLRAAEPRGPASVAFVNQAMDALEGKADPAPIARRLLAAKDGFLFPESVSPFQEPDLLLWFIAAGRTDDAVARLGGLAAWFPYYARQQIADPNLDSIRCRPDFRDIVAKVGSGDPRAEKVCGTDAIAAR
ncbi:MAG TPA: tetratricopeptide repeat protein [Steroidobacteraceae bacterium]|nr:tetratricopeptide repeat protein [Steroidobacteraceae bacterium]